MLDDIIKTKFSSAANDIRITEMFQFLNSLSENQLHAAPDEFMNILCSAIGKNILPPSLENKLKKRKK